MICTKCKHLTMPVYATAHKEFWVCTNEKCDGVYYNEEENVYGK